MESSRDGRSVGAYRGEGRDLTHKNNDVMQCYFLGLNQVHSFPQNIRRVTMELQWYLVTCWKQALWSGQVETNP